MCLAEYVEQPVPAWSARNYEPCPKCQSAPVRFVIEPGRPRVQCLCRRGHAYDGALKADAETRVFRA